MKKRKLSGRKWDRRKDLASSIKTHGRVVLLPASELTKLPTWDRRARELHRAELVVIPSNNPCLERAVQRIKVIMSRHGRPVIVTKVH